jgi:hypothetical protein
MTKSMYGNPRKEMPKYNIQNALKWIHLARLLKHN